VLLRQTVAVIDAMNRNISIRVGKFTDTVLIIFTVHYRLQTSV